MKALKVVHNSFIPQYFLVKMDSRLHFVFQSSTKIYFVSDFVDGGTLSYYIQNDLLCLADIVLIAAELVIALDAIHQCNFVFRDLKPDNILINEEGHVRLVDFGLCSSANARWTGGATPEYLPPEGINRSSFDETGDWWQLGIVVWEMVTKSTPFNDRTPAAIYSNIQNKRLEKPSNMSIGISFEKGNHSP